MACFILLMKLDSLFSRVSQTRGLESTKAPAAVVDSKDSRIYLWNDMSFHIDNSVLYTLFYNYSRNLIFF